MAEREGVSFVAWALACYGVTLIITGSLLLSHARRIITNASPWLGKLVSCPMCTGFWVGALLALHEPLRLVSSHLLALDVVLTGASSSALCFVLHVLLTRLGAEDM